MLGSRQIRRSSIICSTGNDKYTYDSETVELPLRPIDAYEKQLSQQSTASSTSSSASGGRTFSKFSSSFTEDDNSDYHHPRHSSSSPLAYERRKLHLDRDSTSPSVAFAQPSPSSSSPPPSPALPLHSSKLKCKRNSIVHSANLEPVRSVKVDGRFQNPWNLWLPFRFTNILKFGLSKDNSNLPKKEQLDIVLPIVKPCFHENSPAEGVRITWLGHSTVLVQFDGITFLTDPIFSDRASPSQIIGPKRFREIPCTVDDLPATLDAVVISHNHYDHLDLNTVTLLNGRFGTDLRWKMSD